MWAFVACVGTTVPHGGSNPAFPLTGAHALAPCAACHGEGTPHTLPDACSACHADDVPSPTHNPGQDCGLCHEPAGWTWTVSPTTVPGTEPTEPGSNTSGFVHPYTPPETGCAECHEPDRLSTSHFTAPVPWDCGPCHSQTAWSDSPVVHPVRTPHGDGVLACSDCHPAGPPVAVCSDCHAAIFPHFGGANTPGPAADSTCLSCHPGAE